MFGSGQGGVEGEWLTGLGLGFSISRGTWGKWGSVFWLRWCVWCWGRVGGAAWARVWEGGVVLCLCVL